MNNAAQQPQTTLEQLIVTAERLYAEHGIDAVSARQIAEAAGQKNSSAVNYHFGGKQQLLTAIIDYRVKPMARTRQMALGTLKAQGKQKDLKALVTALVQPYAEQLLYPAEENHYVLLASQLCTRQQGIDLLRSVPGWSAAIDELTHLILAVLGDLPANIAAERLKMMGVQINHTIAHWDLNRRRDSRHFTPEQLQNKVRLLVDYISAGLSATG